MAAENCLQIEKKEIIITGLGTNMQTISQEEYFEFTRNLNRDWYDKWWGKVNSNIAVEIIARREPVSPNVYKAKFGVTWASLSDKSLETAKKFQVQLQEAIDLVEHLNRKFKHIRIK